MEPIAPFPTPPASGGPRSPLQSLPWHDVRFRGGPFVVALVCFLLPFFNLVCTAAPDDPLPLSGLQLVTGTTISKGSDFGSSSDQKVTPQPMAILALLSALAGLSVFALKDHRALWMGLGAGAAGTLFLLLLRWGAQSDVAAEGGGMFVLQTRFGYVLALLSLMAATGVHVYLLRAPLREKVQQHRTALASRFPAPTPPPPPAAGPSQYPLPPGARFDPRTGEPLAPPPTPPAVPPTAPPGA